MASFTQHTTGTAAAEALGPLLEQLLGAELAVGVQCWDGSHLGPADAAATIVVNSPRALRRLLYAPDELGLGRAYVAGELDLEGDIYALLALRDRLAERSPNAHLHFGRTGLATAWKAARRLGALGPPLPPPPEEAALRGRRHSRQRDSSAISHHYDVGNDFYRLLLGPSLTYSCAYWRHGTGLHDPGELGAAQADKHELVCRKLGLAEGMRLLDVGCGWGAMVLHAARHHGVQAVGVTLSAEQADLARRRVADAGLDDRVEIRLADYREIAERPYDAVSSIGMFEHVGLAGMPAYFDNLCAALVPGGRLLNHAISSPTPGSTGFDARSFVERYVFPDGELHEVGSVVTAMAAHGFEVRDVESLREHYARTCRAWVANLEAAWEDAVALVGASRARIWRLYLAGSATNFEAGRTNIHQVLAVRPGRAGASGMPPTRDGLLTVR